ncbi:MAG: hypothetical protein IT529_01010 [Burkholderiales bacterium]|nr:hypothetical protein [Burkholderiales bacterium]
MILNLLKRLFAAFLDSHSLARHFRRLAPLETVTRTGVRSELPPDLARELTAAAERDADALFPWKGHDYVSVLHDVVGRRVLDVVAERWWLPSTTSATCSSARVPWRKFSERAAGCATGMSMSL